MLLSLGEALIDLIPPSGAELRRTSELTVQPGGAPFNVAIALSRLDVPVTFLGALSNDAFGLRLADLLASAAIARLPTLPVGGPTRLALVDHASTEGAHFRFYGERTADTLLTTEDVDVAFASNPSGLYVTSLLLENREAAAVQRYAVELATERGVLVFTDPNPRPPAWANLSDMQAAVQWLLESSHHAKLSLDDTRALGWTDRPDELISRLKNESPAQIVVTDGDRGCWALIEGRIVHVVPPTVISVDPTGAGDAFCGTMIASIIDEGRLTVDGLQRACVAGALATTAQGAAVSIPNKRRIEQFLADCDSRNGR